jgi:hypothetical protein
VDRRGEDHGDRHIVCFVQFTDHLHPGFEHDPDPAADQTRRAQDPLARGSPQRHNFPPHLIGCLGSDLLICLEKELTLAVMRAMTEQQPKRVVCLDSGFAGNDQLKTNAMQIFKTKGVSSFKTV